MTPFLAGYILGLVVASAACLASVKLALRRERAK